jgi:hypothetical protein
MTAPSDFRLTDLLAVHGPSPACFQTALRGTPDDPLDAHPIRGRGGKDAEERAIHASVLNCAVLRRSIHHGPLRDRPLQRQTYLAEAFRKAMEAVLRGDYALSDIDRAFPERYGSR